MFGQVQVSPHMPWCELSQLVRTFREPRTTPGSPTPGLAAAAIGAIVEPAASPVQVRVSVQLHNVRGLNYVRVHWLA
jgi:hypothetical protein